MLRPLRLISRNAGMKLIIQSLFKAGPAIGNVFGVVMVLQLVFAILGMQLFAGTFGECTNPAVRIKAECTDEAYYGTGAGMLPAPDDATGAHRSLKGGGGHAWVEGDPLRWEVHTTGSFDDFGQSMLMLYIMSSGDQWEVPMFSMMAATEPGHAPVRNDFAIISLFPMIWMFVGYVFAINLFVGVVVDNFSRQQKAEDGSASMTPEQQQWAATMKGLAKAVPSVAMRAPENCIRRNFYYLVNSQAFDGFITFVIIANIFVMACDYWGIEQDVQVFNTLNNISFCFGLIYYVECILKMTALGPTNYFADSWCQFDFFLVCTSLLDQFAADVLDQIMPLPPMLLRVLRVLRILRILRLLKGAKELRNLIITMVLSFPSLLNVGSLLTLVIFIYAVLGVNLFTFLNTGPVGGAGAINDERNFVSFGSSFLLLFQCLTGDAWSSIMGAAMIDADSGKCSVEAGDCGSGIAVPYFITFQIIGSFVFLNLIVAVILENFANLYNIDTTLVSSYDLEMFSEAWQEVCPCPRPWPVARPCAPACPCPCVHPARPSPSRAPRAPPAWTQRTDVPMPMPLQQFDPDADNYIPIEDVPNLLLKVPKPLGVKGRPKRHAVKLCLLLRLETRDGEVAFADLLKAIIDNNYMQSGADLDEFKEVAPGVVMPPLMPGKKKEFSGSVVPLEQIFGKQIFESESVKTMFRNMLKRARKRIDDRGGPADPKTYVQVYVKGGFVDKDKQAAAMLVRAASAKGGLVASANGSSRSSSPLPPGKPCPCPRGSLRTSDTQPSNGRRTPPGSMRFVDAPLTKQDELVPPARRGRPESLAAAPATSPPRRTGQRRRVGGAPASAPAGAPPSSSPTNSSPLHSNRQRLSEMLNSCRSPKGSPARQSSTRQSSTRQSSTRQSSRERAKSSPPSGRRSPVGNYSAAGSRSNPNVAAMSQNDGQRRSARPSRPRPGPIGTAAATGPQHQAQHRLSSRASQSSRTALNGGTRGTSGAAVGRRQTDRGTFRTPLPLYGAPRPASTSPGSEGSSIEGRLSKRSPSEGPHWRAPPAFAPRWGDSRPLPEKSPPPLPLFYSSLWPSQDACEN